MFRNQSWLTKGIWPPSGGWHVPTFEWQLVSTRRSDVANSVALQAPYPGQSAGEGESSAIDLRDFFAILRARSGIIAASVVACLVLGALIVVMTPKSYTATVSILLDVSQRAPLGSDAGVLNGAPDATLVDTQVRLFTSDAVLRRVAQQENLGEDPEFVSIQPGLRARLFAMLGMAPSAEPGAVDRLSVATAALQRAIAVKRSEKTYVVDVDITARDPAKAAQLANSVAGAYLADQRAARAQVNRRDTAALNQRIAELQTRLLEAENRAQDFRIKNGLVDANGKNLVELELADAAAEVAKAKAKASDAKVRADVVKAAAASGRFAELGDVARFGVLDRLRGQVGDLTRQEANLRTTLAERHPALRELQSQIASLRQQITQELQRLAEAASADYLLAQKSVAEAERRVDLAREAAQRNNHVMVQLREHERDVEVSRDVYQRFLRSREAIADGGDGQSARVIAPAQTPVAPSAPKTFTIMFLAGAAGLFFGTGGALLVDFMGGASASARGRQPGRSAMARSSYAGDMKVVARVPRISSLSRSFAGLVGFLLRSRLDGPVPANPLLREADRHPKAAFADAIGQAFQASLGRLSRRRGRSSHVVLVTSLQPGAGKSVVASNLAFAAAAAGRSVLLIDGHAEAPVLSALISPELAPGVIELNGDYRPLFHVPGSKGAIDLVPILPDEEEICFRLAQQRGFSPVRGINGTYDFVVIDGPTLRGEDDDRDLARAADRILIVVPEGEIDRTPVEDLLYELEVPLDKFAGTVISRARRAKASS